MSIPPAHATALISRCLTVHLQIFACNEFQQICCVLINTQANAIQSDLLKICPTKLQTNKGTERRAELVIVCGLISSLFALRSYRVVYY